MNKFDDIFDLDEIVEIKKYLVVIGDFDMAHEARKREKVLILKVLRNEKMKRIEDDDI